MSSAVRRHPPVNWKWIIGAYVVVSLIYTGEETLRAYLLDLPMSSFELYGGQFLYWGILVAELPFILWVARRFRIEKATLFKVLIPHLAFFLVFVTIHSFVWMISWNMIFIERDLLSILSEMWDLRSRHLLALMFYSYKYFAILAVYVAFDYSWRYKQEEIARATFALERSNLQAQLSRAQFDALRMQLHPHFLFNTLNAISILIDEEPEKANRMLHHLSDLLRFTLEKSGRDEVQLAEEIDYIQRYLRIEQIRFEDRLTVTYDIPEETMEIRIPNLILQPLVENAIKHGIAPSAKSGHIHISSSVSEGDVVICVEDNGAGFPGDEQWSEGIGLSNTRARLDRFSRAYDRFRIGIGALGGARVTLVLPKEVKL